MRERKVIDGALAAVAALAAAACASVPAPPSHEVAIDGSLVAEREPLSNPPPVRGTEAQIAAGAQLFVKTCAVCHGQNAVGGIKDLRHMTPDAHAEFNAIVLDGLYLEKGMPSFADILTPERVEAIHHYLIARANEDWGEH
jgi:quinohemoprotein ethanol dehydrogenase